MLQENNSTSHQAVSHIFPCTVMFYSVLTDRKTVTVVLKLLVLIGLSEDIKEAHVLTLQQLVFTHC